MEEIFNNFDEIEKLATKIKDAGLSHVMEFLVESHLPAFNVLHSIFLCSKPFMVPFVSSNTLNVIDNVLTESKYRDHLLQALEGAK